uniref:Uncharacterized protein n=1 Tax=Siphoviridae sp. ct43U4 TaxID=2826285 RepID=A0A8S5N074_9CAUD|nr:MAG TPA: hypothetical protein [Siphoviridae sp. ct43U4]
MEKTTLLKIIREVRNLEVRKSKNDSQFKFYYTHYGENHIIKDY